MNTNMMTICNILNQQIGVSSVDKAKIPNTGDIPFVPDTANLAAEKSYNNNENTIKNKVPSQDDRSAFNHKLSEKINAQTDNSDSLACPQIRAIKKGDKTTSFPDIPVSIAAAEAIPAALGPISQSIQAIKPAEKLDMPDRFSNIGKYISAEVLTQQQSQAPAEAKTIISSSGNAESLMPALSDSASTIEDGVIRDLQKPVFFQRSSERTLMSDCSRTPAGPLDSQIEKHFSRSAASEPSEQIESASAEASRQLHQMKFNHNTVLNENAPDKISQDSGGIIPQNQNTPSIGFDADFDAQSAYLSKSIKSEDKNNLILAKTTVQKLNIAAEQIQPLYVEKSQTAKDNLRLKSTSDKQSLVQMADLAADKNPVQTDSLLPKPVQSIHSSVALGRQIQESVAAFYHQGTRQIVVRLDPPELGRITIKFIERQNGLTGILHVDKSQTKHEIQQLLPEIVLNLQSSDVPIKKLEVVLSSQQNNAAQEHSARDSGSSWQEQQSAQNTIEIPSEEWSSRNNPAAEHEDSLPNMRIEVSDKTINLLA